MSGVTIDSPDRTVKTSRPSRPRPAERTLAERTLVTRAIVAYEIALLVNEQLDAMCMADPLNHFLDSLAIDANNRFAAANENLARLILAAGQGIERCGMYYEVVRSSHGFRTVVSREL